MSESQEVKKITKRETPGRRIVYFDPEIEQALIQLSKRDRRSFDDQLNILLHHVFSAKQDTTPAP
jgi:hypothetical protein